MPEETQNEQEAKTAEEQPQEQQNKQEEQPERTTSTAVSIDDLPAWAQEHIRELREESKARRHALREIQEQKEREEEERKREAGQYQELYEKAQSKLEALSGAKERMEEYEGIFRESNDKRIEAIPEDMRSLIPQDMMTPAQLHRWLDTNEVKLKKRSAPDIDAGRAGERNATRTWKPGDVLPKTNY